MQYRGWTCLRAPLGLLLAGVLAASAAAQSTFDDRMERPPKLDQPDVFRQLEEILPTPNAYRTGSGAPGHGYWQQKVDYDIEVTLDDETRRLRGRERITYHNASPDELRYLWVQLDANIFRPDSDSNRMARPPDLTPPAADPRRPRRAPQRERIGRLGATSAKRMIARDAFEGGVEITEVTDAAGRALPHTIVKTMMRIDLPQPLPSGGTTVFRIGWEYTINDADRVRGRTAAEYFEKDGNWIYEVAQWFPRMAPYEDVNGWQNKQFIGNGEFALEFGDYRVRITVPDDHIVAATGVLQNEAGVLTAEQRDRLQRARSATTPVFVVTPEEAKANEATPPTGTKTWVFEAKNVRDFAWASSRKFIWDALGHTVDGKATLGMSFYPNEGEPLWSRYSTHAIVHTIDVYSKFTQPYPYPVAISVNGPVGGMEYPMICFNGPRPEEDGSYSKRTKYGLISVIIHEVGHNWFPMIINSDERQWTWMDEGFNTFVQFLTEQEWEEDYPSRRGEARNIVDYMSSFDQVPIMTNSESLHQFGNNAYAKPATAFNILRETIMGRDLFDFAFKEYSRRWWFKRPMPADFFRTMEDASAVDLDWFWRGWFYSTDHVDLAIEDVRLFEMDTGDPAIDKARRKEDRDVDPEWISRIRNADLPKRADRFPELKDFYNDFDELDVTWQDEDEAAKAIEELDDDARALLAAGMRLYLIDIENLGGLVMPVLLGIEFEDGSFEEHRVPAEIWRRHADRATTMIRTDKTIARLTLDPNLETADVDLSNNHYPRRTLPSRFKLYNDDRTWENPMQKARDAEEERKARDAGLDERADTDVDGGGKDDG